MTTKQVFILWRFEIDKTVAHAPLGEDVLGFARVRLYFLAQVGDVQPHVLAFIAIFIAPHFGENHLVGHDLPGVLYQVVQQPKFGGAQFDFFAVHCDHPAVEIDLQVIVHFNN